MSGIEKVDEERWVDFSQEFPTKTGEWNLAFNCKYPIPVRSSCIYGNVAAAVRLSGAMWYTLILVLCNYHYWCKLSGERKRYSILILMIFCAPVVTTSYIHSLPSYISGKLLSSFTKPDSSPHIVNVVFRSILSLTPLSPYALPVDDLTIREEEGDVDSTQNLVLIYPSSVSADRSIIAQRNNRAEIALLFAIL